MLRFKYLPKLSCTNRRLLNVAGTASVKNPVGKLKSMNVYEKGWKKKIEEDRAKSRLVDAPQTTEEHVRRIQYERALQIQRQRLTNQIASSEEIAENRAGEEQFTDFKRFKGGHGKVVEYKERLENAKLSHLGDRLI